MTKVRAAMEPAAERFAMSDSLPFQADDPLPPLGDVVTALAGPAVEVEGEPAPEGSGGLAVASITIDFPVELEIRTEPDGALRLAGAPPIQKTETTIMPVFHRLRLRIVTGEEHGE